MCGLPKTATIYIRTLLNPIISIQALLSRMQKAQKNTHRAHLQSQVRPRRPTDLTPPLSPATLQCRCNIHTFTHNTMNGDLQMGGRLKCLQVAADEANFDGSNIWCTLQRCNSFSNCKRVCRSAREWDLCERIYAEDFLLVLGCRLWWRRWHGGETLRTLETSALIVTY